MGNDFGDETQGAGDARHNADRTLFRLCLSLFFIWGFATVRSTSSCPSSSHYSRLAGPSDTDANSPSSSAISSSPCPPAHRAPVRPDARHHRGLGIAAGCACCSSAQRGSASSRASSWRSSSWRAASATLPGRRQCRDHDCRGPLALPRRASSAGRGVQLARDDHWTDHRCAVDPEQRPRRDRRGGHVGHGASTTQRVVEADAVMLLHQALPSSSAC